MKQKERLIEVLKDGEFVISRFEDLKEGDVCRMYEEDTNSYVIVSGSDKMKITRGAYLSGDGNWLVDIQPYKE